MEQEDNHIPDTINSQIKRPVPGMEYLPSKLLNRGVPEDLPARIKAIATAFVCSLEIDGKTVLLRIPYTMTTWDGEIKLVLMVKCHPFFKAFIISSGAIQVAF